MPGLRLLLRAAPFLVGAVAAAVWLRRMQPQRPRLEPPKPVDAAHPESAPALSEPRTGRFDREPIDIVTVVDDLLDAGR
jgi:hypothetical protein